MEFINRFWDWLRDGKSFWFAFLPIFALLPLWLWVHEDCSRLGCVRISGVIFGILGLYTVVKSLALANEKYRPNYFPSLWKYLSQVKFIFKRGPDINIHVSGLNAGVHIGGAAKVVVDRNPQSDQEKLEYLMMQVKQLEAGNREHRDLLEAHMRESKQKFGNIESHLNSHVKQVNKTFEEIAVQNFNLLISGAILTAISIFMTGMPDSILQGIFVARECLGS